MRGRRARGVQAAAGLAAALLLAACTAGSAGRGASFVASRPSTPGSRSSGAAPSAALGRGVRRVGSVGRAARAGGDAASEYRGPQLLAAASLLAALAVFVGVGEQPAAADSALISSKIRAGGASSSNKDSLGSKKTITRGMNLDNANFNGQDLSGVSFQQSLVRQGRFVDAKLIGTSFFDADLQGADFTGAQMTQANLELARLTDAVFDNAIATEMYVNGTTRMEPMSITGADFTDTGFRKDQLLYLCKIAKGTNPVTKVDTRESLMCPE